MLLSKFISASLNVACVVAAETLAKRMGGSAQSYFIHDFPNLPSRFGGFILAQVMGVVNISSLYTQ